MYHEALPSVRASVLHVWRICLTLPPMKTLTVRLPDAVVMEIEQESRLRRVSKSDIVRERLLRKSRSAAGGSIRQTIADLIGSVEGLPPTLSRNKKKYLAENIRAKKTDRR